MRVQIVLDALKASAGVVVTTAAFLVAVAVLIVAQILVFTAHLAADRAG
ncbi:hypothetical protein IA539_03575 [Gordonia sp. zg691]|uniref:Uncharacterized protein n=1 Tax=Gordonia jinghuaiqii TaxID=2758710 RepID=A0A7D7QHF0_9ACTN|nr:hypothetical protein [Gordonia jinghuaiqii]MBD0860288.1 hypothetical protein [Gordonia jinghuaiqii]QMT01204.1 hypothetical protein H1R19_20530 [Gordonia jinghuaiqii]